MKNKKHKLQDDFNKYINELYPTLEKTVQELGFDLMRALFVAEHGVKYLRLTISHQDRLITVEDCEQVSRSVDKALDLLDIIPFPYSLEVESPGADFKLDSQISSFDLKGFGKVTVGDL